MAGAFTGGLAAGWSIPLRPADVAARLTGRSTVEQAPVVTNSPTSTPNPSTAGFVPPTELNKLFPPFWEAWDLVHQEYVDQPVDDLKLMQGAIRGMLGSLGDPHTAYMDPSEYQQATSSLNGGYEGIGAWVDSNQEFLTIVSPMPGSPAESAGLKPGDTVIAVDGADMTGVDGQLVIQKIIGPAGSQVTLTITRKGADQPLDVKVTRGKIEIPSVMGKMLDNNIAYVGLFTFGETTKTELVKTLEPLLAKNPKGLILDLRGNGGGYLKTAIEVASQFIDTGAVLYERYGDGTEQIYTAQKGGTALTIPLVILVNEGTASASEIVAGAIQDAGRGKLVGVKTYGKGSVQDWVELKENQGAVRVTIAHWYTPNKRLIDKTGLEPDVEIQLTDANIQAKQDTQLEKAVELLTTTP
jgi:carboxyl-terminal processing protease